VKGPLPQFGYQLHLAGPEVEAALQSEEQIRQFLNGMYGGKGPNGELAFDPVRGVLIENLPKLGKGRLFSDKVSSAEGKGACLLAMLFQMDVDLLDLDSVQSGRRLRSIRL